MLIWFVVLYLMLSIGIGLYVATRVHTAKDFAVAGRRLPLPVVTATESRSAAMLAPVKASISTPVL